MKMDEYVSAKCAHLHLPVTFTNTDKVTSSNPEKWPNEKFTLEV
jgi:hypothetical protein